MRAAVLQLRRQLARSTELGIGQWQSMGIQQLAAAKSVQQLAAAKSAVSLNIHHERKAPGVLLGLGATQPPSFGPFHCSGTVVCACRVRETLVVNGIQRVEAGSTNLARRQKKCKRASSAALMVKVEEAGGSKPGDLVGRPISPWWVGASSLVHGAVGTVALFSILLPIGYD